MFYQLVALYRTYLYKQTLLYSLAVLLKCSELYKSTRCVVERGDGCLYLVPRGMPVQCAEVPGLLSFQKCYKCILASKKIILNIRLFSQACSEYTSCISNHQRKAATKRTKVKCTLSYLSVTSMGITGIEDKHKIYRVFSH
jgi:hypothetical protein